MPKIRTIIIIIAIVAALVLVYFLFLRASPDQGTLVSSPSTSLPGITGDASAGTSSGTSAVTSDFLTLLLNVKTIKLNDGIFSDPAFNTLHDSSIVLTPDGTEGRPNPFAQFGNDVILPVLPGSTPAAATITPIQTTSPAKTTTTTTTAPAATPTTTGATTPVTPVAIPTAAPATTPAFTPVTTPATTPATTVKP